MDRVVVGLPVYDHEESVFSECLGAAIATGAADVVVQRIVGTNTPNARNMLVQNARRNNATHVFFMDVDMWFPRGTLDCLLYHDKDIVAGYYHATNQGLIAQVFKDEHTTYMPKSGLLEVKMAGTGCMLIRLSVFDKLEYPYFNYAPVDDKEILASEDRFFCDRVVKAGFKIHCDTDIRCGHVGKFIVMPHETENKVQFLGVKT